MAEFSLKEGEREGLRGEQAEAVERTRSVLRGIAVEDCAWTGVVSWRGRPRSSLWTPSHHETRRAQDARPVYPPRQRTGFRFTGATVTGAMVVGPRLLGPSAMAPVAIAACAVGALAIGRLAIAEAVVRRLRAGEIEIGSLKVRELEVAGRRWPELGGAQETM